MSRLIDADAIPYRTIRELLPDSYVTNTDINEMPTVDAVPVVHGHWIVIENDQNTDDRYKMQCSVCGETLWSIEPEELYCCKCGAKMDSNDSNALNALNAMDEVME